MASSIKRTPMSQRTLGKAPRIDIGISEPNRRKIAAGLGRLLADTYTLYLKTHNFHWNVTGPMFQTLHLMFEEQYTEQWQAADLIAERIRALGFPAPGTFKEFLAATSIAEPSGTPAAEEMVRELVEGQEAVVRTARSVLPIAEKVDDQPTVDLLTQRLQTQRPRMQRVQGFVPGAAPDYGDGRASAKHRLRLTAILGLVKA